MDSGLVTIALIAAGAALLPLLLKFEAGLQRTGMLLTKSALSISFVVVGLLQPDSVPGYRPLIVAGLVFCLAGDVLLALPQQRAFLAGLVAFLIGHVWYVIAFTTLGSVTPVVIGLWIALGGVSGAIHAWLKPHLGTLRRAVAAYVIVISLMVATAIAVATNGAWSPAGRAMVIVGALLFYVSDIFVARDRFLGRDIRNRRIGLPAYYTAQFLIALSIGVLGA